MSDPVPTTTQSNSTIERNKVFEFVKLMLGDGMVEVELDPAHYELALDLRLHLWWLPLVGPPSTPSGSEVPRTQSWLLVISSGVLLIVVHLGSNYMSQTTRFATRSSIFSERIKCRHARRSGSPSAGSWPRFYCISARPFAAAGHDPGPDRGRHHFG